MIPIKNDKAVICDEDNFIPIKLIRRINEPVSNPTHM